MHSKKILVLLLLLTGLGWTSDVAALQNVVVVLDDSGSMDEQMRTARGRVRRIDAAKHALSEVLGKLPAETNVGLLTLNTRFRGSNWIIPLGPVDERVWQSNLQQIEASGGTPLGEYLKLGADQLLVARSKQVYGTYRLLLVTDGEANDQELVDSYLPDLLSRGISLDVIGVDMRSEHSLATRAHTYRRADDDSALTKAISAVFAETSTDDQDDIADFEMLAALPDEFATEALKVLSKRNDQPIQEAKFTANLASRGNGNLSGGPVDDVVATAIGFGLICCLGSVFFFAAMIGVLYAFRRRR